MTKITALVLGAAGAGLLATASAATAQLACGGTVGPGGTFVLTEDLDCRDDPGCRFPRRCTPALTVVGKAVLNLNGHTIHCSSGDDDGVLVTGTGAVVRDGHVNICGTGVRLAGEGRHVVRNIVSSRSKNDGFTIVSDGNELLSSVADTSGSNGFNLLGANGNTLTGNVATRTQVFNGFNVSGGSERNRLRDNVAAASARNGFNVGSRGNKLMHNTSSGNGNRGFNVLGAANVLRGNRAASNAVGIDGAGSGNVFERNTALDNETADLSEVGGCDNTWRRNVFGATPDPDCVR